MEVAESPRAELSEDVDPPFLQLPEEMFLYICSFLNVTDIVSSLSHVCKKFYDILQSESIWKSWIAARWGRQYALADIEENINWKKTCFSLEKNYKTWSGFLREIVIKDAHLADVDATLFLNEGKTCVTSSRDRNIIVWDCDGYMPKLMHKCCAHEGWVWRLRWLNKTLYSASWDSTIKLWDLVDSELVQKQQLRCESAVLSINLDSDGILYGGGFKRVHAFDPRVQNDPIFSLASGKPVLTLNCMDNDLIVGGETQTLAVWDKRTRALNQTVRLSGANFPTSSQILGRCLYVGDKEGNIRLYTKREGEYVETVVVNISESKAVSCLKVLPGGIFAGSGNTVRAVLPLIPALSFANLRTKGGAISGLDCCNERLAVGSGSYIEFYMTYK